MNSSTIQVRSKSRNIHNHNFYRIFDNCHNGFYNVGTKVMYFIANEYRLAIVICSIGIQVCASVLRTTGLLANLYIKIIFLELLTWTRACIVAWPKSQKLLSIDRVTHKTSVTYNAFQRRTGLEIRHLTPAFVKNFKYF